MMRNRKLIKDKSLYSIKNVHTKTSKGTIYENDYVTIVKDDGIFDETPLFSNSIFKYKIRLDNNEKKRHTKNDWVLTESGSEIWTKDKINNEIVNEDSKIVLKPNYSSLKDFAYFGSAVELIKATINDIILRFPGGLYFYDNKELTPSITINKKKYYLISNECEIYCWTPNITTLDKDKNPLRYLSYSYKDYGLSNSPIINLTGTCIDSIVGDVNINNIKLYIYKNSENKYQLLVDEATLNQNLNNKKIIIIEPKAEIKEKFWNSLDDFERVLLDRKSTPIYTAVFDTPYKDETGYYFTPKRYTWPTITGTMVPDLSTIRYEGYVKSLMELAYFHDEYDSDNLWRMMTHESIKNLDWTFTSNNVDNSDIDNGRMKAMLNIEARQFDDLKRNIDNIKASNSISYNEQNNVPDYFLSDILENSGWEPKNIINSNETSDFNIISIGSGNTSAITITSGKTAGFVNSTFLRRLALSSNYIQSMKGTKKGLETMLKILGFSNDEFEILEYSAKVKELKRYCDAVNLRVIFDYVNADENTNFMQGYPVALIESSTTEGDLITMLAPWYNPKEKYEGNFYYQCKGGWGKMNRIKIKREISSNTEIEAPFLYKETEPYMIFANTLDEMLSFPNDRIKDNIVCYVSDINNIDKIYKIGNEDINGAFSNYFILKNTYMSTHLGYVEGKCYGWKNVKVNEYNGTGPVTNDGKMVLYLESLVQMYNGNNPHIGKGEYDFGEDYLNKYINLFREAIKNGKCDNISDEKKAEIDNFGFEIEGISNEKSKICVPLNEEDDNDYENESLKVINLKNLTVRFNMRNVDSGINYDEYKNYITEVVIPYLELMLPSTIIVEYLFGDEKSHMETMLTNLTSTSKEIVYSMPQPADVITTNTDMWVENNDWMK